MPPGVYVFGVNLTKEPYGRPRGKSVFLPGTALASQAAVIELKAGDSKEVGVLRLVEAVLIYFNGNAGRLVFSAPPEVEWREHRDARLGQIEARRAPAPSRRGAELVSRLRRRPPSTLLSDRLTLQGRQRVTE